MGLRILADEDVPGEAVTALREQGHDVAWMVTAAPGSGDPEVLLRAQAEARVLMTFDKDFGELAFRYGLPASSGVILFRVKTQSSPLGYCAGNRRHAGAVGLGRPLLRGRRGPYSHEAASSDRKDVAVSRQAYTPWHQVVRLRDGLRSGKLLHAIFSADLYCQRITDE